MMADENNICQDLTILSDFLKNDLKNKTVVYTYGAWDIVHPGHIKFLRRAKALGDFLIVGTVSDKPIRSLKGPDRPTQSQYDRAVVVSSFSFVDIGILQSDYDPSFELNELERLDILTKGDDWEYIPGQETIKSLGGELIKLGYSEEYSTSKIINQINKKDD